MGTTTIASRPPAPAVRSSRIRELLRLVDRPGVLSLAGGLPAPETLDTARVRAASDRALERSGPLGPVALQYGPTEGVDELRAIVAQMKDDEAAHAQDALAAGAAELPVPVRQAMRAAARVMTTTAHYI